MKDPPPEIKMDEEAASTMTQPLLELELVDEDEGPIKEHQEKDSSVFLDEKNVFRRTFFFGTLTGLVVHTISLGAYATILIYNRREKEAENTSGPVMTSLSLLTQLNLLVYVLIWIAFMWTLTGSGIKMIRKRLGKHIQRRNISILGLCFLFGIVLGAFVAWSLVDSYFGFVPLAPIAGTVFIDLLLCYLVIWFY